MKQSSSYGWGSFWSFIFWCCIIFIILWFIWAVPSSGAGYNFWWWWILIFIGVWWLCDIVFYIPVGVSSDDNTFRVKRAFGSREVPINDIASVKVYQVKDAKAKGKRISPAALSTKWGHYTSPEIGDFEAYYSNPDKTVLITLKNGSKLVVGSKDPQALADYLNDRIKA